MNKKIEDILALNNNDDTFTQILELPDEVFDEIYPTLMERLEPIYASAAIQNQAIQNISLYKGQNFNDAFAELDKMIDEIQEMDELSENKRAFLTTFAKKSKELTKDLYENPRERITVKVVKDSPDAILPTYAHPTDAGADVYSIEDVEIQPNETKLISTGLKVAIPAGYEIQLRPRSGLSLKTGLRIANATATIDSSYRGVIKVILHNVGTKTEKVAKGDRIAQMLIAPTPMIKWSEVESLDETDRGSGGFGSTGS